MASDDSRGAGADAGQPGHALVLELVIYGPDPLTGLVGRADGTDRICFHGWIDLMSAVRTLWAGHAESPPAAG